MMRKLVLLGLALWAAPSSAMAGDFHFSIGGLGHCHGPFHCHPRYVFSWAPPPRPVLVYPPPVVAPTYVYPGYAQQAPAAAPASNWNAAQARPNTLPANRAAAVTIRNPADNGGAVAFVIDQQTEVSLDGGESHSRGDRDSYVVEFDRGGDYGAARKTITEGEYEFVVTSRGWDLVARQPAANRSATKPIKRNALPPTFR